MTTVNDKLPIPGAIKGAIHGKMLMVIGFACIEEMMLEEGRKNTNSLRKYGLPTIAYIADESIPMVMKMTRPFRPLGAKGFTQNPPSAMAPAIAKAI